MRKIFYSILLLLITHVARAQCSIGDATSTCSNTTYAKSTIQTFTPSCSGVLSSVVIPGISVFADDLRNSGYYVIVKIRSANGTLLASLPKTDDWYPNKKNVSFDFSCYNVFVNAGASYQLEFYESSGTTELILFCKSNTSIYQGGNLIEDGVSRSSSDITKWNVNIAASPALATSFSSATQNVSCGLFKNSSSELLAFVKPGSSNGITGSTTAKVWIDNNQPGNYVKRYYEITPSTNPATATGSVTFYYTQAEFDGFNAVNAAKLPTGPSDAAGIANLLVEKRPGTSSDVSGKPLTYPGTPATINPADANVVWNSSALRWEVSFDVTGFSGFFIKTQSGPLPVTLASFNVEKQEKTALLSWTTSSEVNSVSFDIQRSANGENWTDIGLVATESSSKALKSYEFKDLSPLEGQNLYRLKMVDLDGSFAYSRIQSIAFTDLANISAYPNPARELTTVRVSKSYVGSEANLINTSGRQLGRIRILQETFDVDLSSYAPGIYFLQTQDKKTIKIIKQ